MTVLLIPALLLLALLIVRPLTFEFLHLNSSKWVLGIYTLVLLLSIPVLYLLPRTDFAASNSNQGGLINLYDAAKTGRLDRTAGISAKSTRSFAYSSSQLFVVGEPDMTMLMAERKASDDGKIEAIYYVGTTTLNGVDYADKLKPPTLELAGNVLRVTSPPPYQVTLGKFTKDFTVNQFYNDVYSLQGSSGQEALLLLRIPKSLQLDDRAKRILFIGE